MVSDVAQQELADLIKSFRTSELYSDLTITCGPDKHNVHKVVVCGRVKFFACALKYRDPEDTSATIDLPDDDPTIIKLLLDYLYESDYQLTSLECDINNVSKTSIPASDRVMSRRLGLEPELRDFNVFPHTCTYRNFDCISDCRAAICIHHKCNGPRYSGGCCKNFTCQECLPAQSGKGGSEQMLIHAKVYETADKYGIMGLKDFAMEKFRKLCDLRWDAHEFVIAARHAFTSTPECDKGLRNVILSFIWEDTSLLQDPDIERILRDFDTVLYKQWLGQHKNAQSRLSEIKKSLQDLHAVPYHKRRVVSDPTMFD